MSGYWLNIREGQYKKHILGVKIWQMVYVGTKERNEPLVFAMVGDFRRTFLRRAQDSIRLVVIPDLDSGSVGRRTQSFRSFTCSTLPACSLFMVEIDVPARALFSSLTIILT